MCNKHDEYKSIWRPPSQDRWWAGITRNMMRRLIAEKPNGFTGDDFYKMCVEAHVPKGQIKKLSGKTFRQFSVNEIEKTNEYRLSERNSSPLPVWVKKK